MYKGLFSLDGKTAVITGASRGLGKAIALAMANAGADLVISARTESAVKDAAMEISGSTKRKVVPVSSDVRYSEQIDRLFGETIKEFGRVDILINNAGGTFTSQTVNISEHGFDALVQENLKSTFMCSQAAVEIMLRQGKGIIVNTASVGGIGCATYCSLYGATKAAVLSLTRTMAVELAPFNIRINAVAPGTMKTESGLEMGKQYPKMINRIPMKRMGTPEEITGAYVFLSSDASSYMTGTVIVVDGGLLASSGVLE